MHYPNPSYDHGSHTDDRWDQDRWEVTLRERQEAAENDGQWSPESASPDRQYRPRRSMLRHRSDPSPRNQWFGSAPAARTTRSFDREQGNEWYSQPSASENWQQHHDGYGASDGTFRANPSTYGAIYGPSGSGHSNRGYGRPSGWNPYNNFNRGLDNQSDFSGKGPRGYRRSDDRIEEDVCELLTRDRHIDASDVDVSVKNGIVQLKGEVSDRWAKRHSEALLDSIPGVRDVTNTLTIAEHPSKSNAKSKKD